MPRIAVIFGQFGLAADPINLPHFRDRLNKAGCETILVEHYDSKAVVNFLRGYKGFTGIVGSSLGAMSSVIIAGYLAPQIINFVGGFQPSDFDPSGHSVAIHSGADLIIRAVSVPKNVERALCFRNPVVAITGGLGHATYLLAPDNHRTKLEVIERPDIHPGDFGVAQDTMFNQIMAASK
jgi:hypothetical protein